MRLKALASYRHATDLPQLLAVFPLEGVLLLPRGALPLNIFEPRYLNMIDDAMASDRMIGVVATRAGGDKATPNLAAVGCAGRITSYAETADGRYLITLTGICRFAVVEELNSKTPYRQVRTDFARFEPDLEEPEDEPLEGGREELLAALKAYLNGRGLDIDWAQAGEAPMTALITSLSMALPFEPAEKQALLEAPTCADRRAALVALLQMGAAAGDDDTEAPMQ